MKLDEFLALTPQDLGNLQALDFAYGTNLFLLTSLEFIDFCQKLSQCVNLRTLNLAHTFPAGGVFAQTQLPVLTLEQQNELASVFYRSIAKLQKLVDVNFSHCELHFNLFGFQCFCHALVQLSKLQTLNLSYVGTQVGNIDLPGIAGLTSIAAGNFFSLLAFDAFKQEFCSTLPRLRNLQELDLSGNSLHTLEIYREVRRENTHFGYAHSFCNLSEALVQCSALRILKLEDNKFDHIRSNEGYTGLCSALKKCLEQCPNLQELHVGRNYLSNDRKKMLQDMMITHNAQVAIPRQEAKAFLLSWNRLRDQEQPITLGALSKILVQDILTAGGYLQISPAGAFEMVRRPLHIRF